MSKRHGTSIWIFIKNFTIIYVYIKLIHCMWAPIGECVLSICSSLHHFCVFKNVQLNYYRKKINNQRPHRKLDACALRCFPMPSAMTMTINVTIKKTKIFRPAAMCWLLTHTRQSCSSAHILHRLHYKPSHTHAHSHTSKHRSVTFLSTNNFFLFLFTLLLFTFIRSS